MLAETDLDWALARSFLMALCACDCTSRADRVTTTDATISAKWRVSFADEESEVARVLASLATVERKSDRSCVVQRERGAVPTPFEGDLVPSEVASNSCSVSDSEQLLLEASVACLMAM
jgi:hypothetical protein